MTPAVARRSILVVDDDPLIAMSTVDLLENLGHSVREANSGDEALKIIRGGEHFDLAAADYSMPRMNGGQLATALRQIRPDLPILLAMGYSDLPRLTKPYDQRQLQRELEKLFGA